MDEIKQRLVEKIKREFGEEIMNLLVDDNVIEIMLNSDGSLWVEKFGEDMKFIKMMNKSNILSAINTISSMMGTSLTAENPIISCELPIDNSRFQALIPPIVAFPTFAIRKKALKIFTLEDYLAK